MINNNPNKTFQWMFKIQQIGIEELLFRVQMGKKRLQLEFNGLLTAEKRLPPYAALRNKGSRSAPVLQRNLNRNISTRISQDEERGSE